MRLSPIRYSPPVFHYWKDFGIGKKRRIPYYKQWWNVWRGEIARKKVADYTLKIEQLPPGSRLMDAEDFMKGHIDLMPDELLKLKSENIVYDHPWPFNVKLDPVKSQELMYNYVIDTRFFTPRDDCLTLANTLLESDELAANPPMEPTDEHLEAIQRRYDWSTGGDSVLVRLPRKRIYPFINRKPAATYGLTKERQEVNVLNSMYDYSQAILAQYYHKLNDRASVDKLLARRSIAFPYCQVPFQRDNRPLNLKLCIDSMAISNSPSSLIDPNPQKTSERSPVDIRPRSWRSLIEQTRDYKPNWSFTSPRDSYPHTIQLASRIKRDHRDDDEMLARSIIHAFGLTAQYARLRQHEKHLRRSEDISHQASAILEDPLGVAGLHDKDLLDQPIVVQSIGFELPSGNFHFVRFQLNTLKFDDSNEARIKNQAWYSGPVGNLREALRYYLDFQSFT